MLSKGETGGVKMQEKTWKEDGEEIEGNWPRQMMFVWFVSLFFFLACDFPEI